MFGQHKGRLFYIVYRFITIGHEGFILIGAEHAKRKGSKTRFHAAFPISNPNQIEPAFLLVTIHKVIGFMISIRYNEGWFENVVKI